MIAVGQTWSMRWSMPHRLEVTIIELQQDVIVCETVHRCKPMDCMLQTMRKTLPIHGRMKYEYRDFARWFLPINRDAIALPAAR